MKPEKHKEYEAEKSHWFPRKETPDHTALEQCTPGLFKVEWSGGGFMGLKSKTYCHWEEGSSNKASCKGISKKLNDPQKKVYLEVPQTGEGQSGKNRGFRVIDNKVLTYM